MKLTSIFLFIAVMQISAMGWSQDAKLMLSFNEATLSELIEAIEAQSEFRVFYKTDQVNIEEKISLKENDGTISSVLSDALAESDLSYRIMDNLIVLTNFTVKQQQTVRGIVTDASTGEPLAGVTIQVKETMTGGISQADGSYNISIPSDAEVLIFSFVGYKTQEISINGRTNINVVMEEEITALEEVIVIGYGTVKKSDLTGSVVSVKSDDLNQGVVTSVDQALQGRIAGAQITQTSSEPGGGLSIRIRGASSINAGNEPLYVIDGLPIDNSGGLAASAPGTEVSANINVANPLNALNPSDIQSIEILKDASATAIYGSRGANGVVLITTKKGAEGGLQVSYDGYAGIQSRAKKIDVLTTSEYINYMNEIYEEQGLLPRFSALDIAEIGAGVDWQDEIFTNAFMQNHNLSLSGGYQKTNYYVSLNYFDQDGVVKKTGTKRYIARINLDQDIGEKLKLGFNLNNSNENSNNFIGGVNTNESAGAVYDALFYDPTQPIYDSEGNYSQSSELNINNPLSVIYGISSKSKTNRMFGNLTVQYDIISDLNAKVNVGFDNQNMRRDVYNSTKTKNGSAAGGYANIGELDRTNILVEYTMNYSKAIGNNHFVNILGGVTYQNFNRKDFSAGTSGFPSDDLATDNLGLGDADNRTVTSNKEENTLLSYLFRINYTFYNFLLTSSVRADGSSRFGANNKWGYFPSFALGWKLSDENFIPEFFNTLKLRASWGVTGNQEIGNYGSLTTYDDAGTAILDGNPYTGTEPSRIANPDLKWESTSQLNFGIDFGIMRGRINGSVDYFNKKTSDMLIDLPLPSSSGFTSVWKNIGSMKNFGFECIINSININRGYFTWKTAINFSAIRNEVTSLGDLDLIQRGDMQVVGGNTTIIKPGEPMDSYYGYNVIGLFRDQDEIDDWVQPTAQPGYPKYQNTYEDTQITPADQVILGNPFPDFTYGISNTLTYKNVELSFFFQGQQGADLLNANALESLYPANAWRNRFADQVNDRWTEDNLDAKYPTPIDFSSWGGSKVTSLVIEDASYIRLKSLQISYNLPIKFWGISSARIYVLGQNLFTITSYSGYDPEANVFGQRNYRIDYSSYPLVRTWMMGVNVQF